jgi:3-phenylpropionate/trans-cinnamate dioxygenase ferredoxin reductase subunit
MSGVLIVGGGLGALRSAEALREAGYTGPVTVIGDEPHLPYTRPPLSKEALAGGVDVATLEFRRRPSVEDVHWRLGAAAASCDLEGGTVTLVDGTVVDFDGLVIATGIRPRRLPLPGPTAGRHVLRTAEDSVAIRDQLRPGQHLIIMGAGFIGCETAATARKLGAEVTIVAIDDEPMVRPLGSALGAGMRRRHESHGVHFHLGHTVDAFIGDDRVEAVMLSDGTELPADIVIEAVGSVTNTEWLKGNGLDLSDGVLVDSAMQVQAADVPVVAVGDIARHPNALFDGVPRRIEHWNMPTETGRRAGQTLAALMRGDVPVRSPFTAMPSFWSDQYDHRLQSFGMPGIATSIIVAEGDADDACIVEYHDHSGLVGVVGVDRTKELLPYRKQLMERPLTVIG